RYCFRHPQLGQAARPTTAGLVGTADRGFDIALVAVSVAFPVEGVAIASQLRDWFGRSEAPLRTALSLALAFHGVADETVKQIVLDEVGQSIRWVRRSGGLIALLPNDSPFPLPGQEPYISSPGPEAIEVAERLRAGTKEQTRDFSPVFSLLMRLLELVGDLIDWPV